MCVQGVCLCVCVMGNTESMESQLAVIRSRAAPVRLPMPDPAELEERFSIALVNKQHTYCIDTGYTQSDRRYIEDIIMWVRVRYRVDYRSDSKHTSMLTLAN